MPDGSDVLQAFKRTVGVLSLATGQRSRCVVGYMYGNFQSRQKDMYGNLQSRQLDMSGNLQSRQREMYGNLQSRQQDMYGCLLYTSDAADES